MYDKRTLTDTPATRDRVPILFGIVSPTGGGKTYSALRLATGMQRIVGGDIFVIDTENGRAKQYADLFKFRHVPFSAPFNPLSYLEAIRYCQSKGAGPIIVDQMSFEHEGEGGVLDYQEREIERLMKAWKMPPTDASREKVKWSAWVVPKRERNLLIGAMQSITSCIICCFRAREKMDVGGAGVKPKKLGWMPIGSPELMYEMMATALLYPGSFGVPTWRSDKIGEMQTVKMPAQFRQLLLGHGKYVQGVGENGAEGQIWQPSPLDENLGFQMASWAAGDSSKEFNRLVLELKKADTADAVKELLPALTAAVAKDAKKEISVKAYEADHLRALYATCLKDREAAATRPAPVEVVADAPRAPAPEAEAAEEPQPEVVDTGATVGALSALIDDYDRRGGDWEEVWKVHADTSAEEMIHAGKDKRAEYAATLTKLMPQPSH